MSDSRHVGEFTGEGTFSHDEYPITQADDFRKLRADDEDRFPFGGQGIDELVNLKLGPNINAARGFIKQQYFSISK